MELTKFLNSILFNNPDIVNLTGNIYGNQSIIGGVNINYSNDKYFLLEDKTRKIDPLEHVNYLEKIGVAEIKITYVHLEGTKNGIDIDYSKKLKKRHLCHVYLKVVLVILSTWKIFFYLGFNQ